MNDQQIEAFIDALSASKVITPLKKDVLDTWHELKKNPFDEESARKQIFSNNISHPDILAAIAGSPDVIQKPFDRVTKEDMIFNLRKQLEGLIIKEMQEQADDREERR